MRASIRCLPRVILGLLLLMTACETDPGPDPPSESEGATVVVEVLGEGSVESDPAGIDCSPGAPADDCRSVFGYTQAVALTATPTSGHRFSRWEQSWFSKRTPNTARRGGSCDESALSRCATQFAEYVGDQAVSSYQLTAVFLEDVGPPPTGSGRIVWTGGGGTSDWFLAANWNLARIPAETDSVEIRLSGAVVDLVDHGLILPTTIRHLTHSAGTLRVSGPTSCPNCARLTVTEGVTSSGSTTLLTLARAVLNIGKGSTFGTVEEEVATGAARGAGVYRTSAASGLLPLTVQRLKGTFDFSGLDVVVTGPSILEGGAGLGQGSLTISPTAVVTITPGDPGSLGSGLDNRVGVEGTLRVLSGVGQFDFGTVEVVPGGVIEVDGAFVRFASGLTNRGTIRRLPGGTFDPGYQVVGTTSLAQGSLLEGRSVDFRGNATLAGQVVMADEIAVAEMPGWSALIEDASRLTTPLLRIGIGPTEIRVAQEATSIETLVSQYTGLAASAPIVVTSTGPGRLVLSMLQLRSRSLSGGSSGGRILAERVLLDGLAVPQLDRIELEIAGPGTSSVGAIVSASNGTRIIQRGRINFTSGGFGRPPLSPPGAFYFEHRGELQAVSGQSSIQGCITTTGGTILPPASPSATLTFFPLDPVECP